MSYDIEISRPALKSLNKIPKPDLLKISKKIEALSTQPFPQGYKKLVGQETLYRIRVGDSRVLYRVFNQQLVIYVVDVGHRKKIYAHT